MWTSHHQRLALLILLVITVVIPAHGHAQPIARGRYPSVHPSVLAHGSIATPLAPRIFLPMIHTNSGRLGQIAVTLSPNGQSDIYIVAPDGASLAQVTNTPRDEAYPAWSPDGEQIAFLTNIRMIDQEHVWDLYSVHVQGSAPPQLIAQSVGAGRPAWSPDGQYLAVPLYRAGQFDIYQVTRDGTTFVNLTQHAAKDTHPSWSPDGTHLSFWSDRAPDHLHIMQADGSQQTRIPTGDKTVYDPTWSPDGRHIAFTDGTSIYRIDPNGAHLTQVTTDQRYDLYSEPSWSPDGRQIAFTISYIRGRWLGIVDLDGSNLTRSSFYNVYTLLSPSWTHGPHR